jgi:hypothetical protein
MKKTLKLATAILMATAGMKAYATTNTSPDLAKSLLVIVSDPEFPNMVNAYKFYTPSKYNPCPCPLNAPAVFTNLLSTIFQKSEILLMINQLLPIYIPYLTEGIDLQEVLEAIQDSMGDIITKHNYANPALKWIQQNSTIAIPALHEHIASYLNTQSPPHPIQFNPNDWPLNDWPLNAYPVIFTNVLNNILPPDQLIALMNQFLPNDVPHLSKDIDHQIIYETIWNVLGYTNYQPTPAHQYTKIALEWIKTHRGYELLQALQQQIPSDLPQHLNAPQIFQYNALISFIGERGNNHNVPLGDADRPEYAEIADKLEESGFLNMTDSQQKAVYSAIQKIMPESIRLSPGAVLPAKLPYVLREVAKGLKGNLY